MQFRLLTALPFLTILAERRRISYTRLHINNFRKYPSCLRANSFLHNWPDWRQRWFSSLVLWS